jgi:hypothetical protein
VVEDVGAFLAEECRHDFVGLWILVREVRERLPQLTVAELRSIVIDIVARALQTHVAVPGEFAGNEFVQWASPLEETLRRIDAGWVALGRDPDIGDLVWLVAPRRPN